MTEQTRHRFLRPGLLIVAGARVWVVDTVQPVALVVDAVTATPDAPPSDYRTSAQLRLARRDQRTRTVRIDAPVQSLRSVDGDLFVEVETGAWTRRPLGSPTSWDLEPETSWLRLPADQDVPGQLSVATHGSGALPPADAWGWRYHHRPDLHDLVAGDDGEPARPQARTPGLDWFVGADRARTSGPVQLFAVAFEAGTARERWRLPLGRGDVVATTASADHLWVAVQRRPARSHQPPSPSAVVRVAAATGQVETVVGPDSVEITEVGWPLGPPPVDAEDYTAFWQHHLGGLDACWTDTGGRVGPLSEGLSDPRVDVVGTWPDTRLDITFSWTHRPGVRLRRAVGLYDDLGRVEVPLYADIHLMEDLDTGHVPTAPDPGSDHLDF